MNQDLQHKTMANAFREATLSLIGIFQIYQVDPELRDATAQTVGSVFRRHLLDLQNKNTKVDSDPLFKLVDELDGLSRRPRGRPRI